MSKLSCGIVESVAVLFQATPERQEDSISLNLDLNRISLT